MYVHHDLICKIESWQSGRPRLDIGEKIMNGSLESNKSQSSDNFLNLQSLDLLRFISQDKVRKSLVARRVVPDDDITELLLISRIL